MDATGGVRSPVALEAGGGARERRGSGVRSATGEAVSGLRSRPTDPRETRRRIEAALAKRERGERLTETEETIVYWLLHGGGCHACGGVRVAVAPLKEGGYQGL